MFCPNCGNNCNDNDVVCGNCGRPLRAPNQPMQNQAAPNQAAPNQVPYGGNQAPYAAAPVAAAPKAKPADAVKKVGKAITGNKTVLYAIIGVAALLVIILLASLIFTNPAGSVALRYEKAMVKGDYAKAYKQTYVNLKEYNADYEDYIQDQGGKSKKFEIADALEEMKEDRIDDFEKEYGKDYKISNMKVLFVKKWDEDDVEDYIDELEDREVMDGRELEDYVKIDKIKAIYTVYITYVIDGKKDSDAGVDTVTVAKIGGAYKVMTTPYYNTSYLYD